MEFLPDVFVPDLFLCLQVRKRNYPGTMLNLPVTAPLSKKIAHLFPVSFRIPKTQKRKGYKINIKILPTISIHY